jgi:hypothetical protein
MIVIMIAITPSLNASNRPLLISLAKNSPIWLDGSSAFLSLAKIYGAWGRQWAKAARSTADVSPRPMRKIWIGQWHYSLRDYNFRFNAHG